MPRSIIITATALFLAVIWLPAAFAADAVKIDTKTNQALDKLLSQNTKAAEFFEEAVAVLVFPSITKGGFIIAGQHGNGALRLLHIKDAASSAYYKSVAVSYGLQAGVQQFGYALFFMEEDALNYLNKTDGWEIGGAPSLVIVDAGVATTLSTTTAKKDIYAFFFNQKGLMAGLGLQGTKVTRIYPDGTPDE